MIWRPKQCYLCVRLSKPREGDAVNVLAPSDTSTLLTAVRCTDRRRTWLTYDKPAIHRPVPKRQLSRCWLTVVPNLTNVPNLAFDFDQRNETRGKPTEHPRSHATLKRHLQAVICKAAVILMSVLFQHCYHSAPHSFTPTKSR